MLSENLYQDEIKAATVRLDEAIADYSTSWATLARLEAEEEEWCAALDFRPVVWKSLDNLAEAAGTLSRLHLALKARMAADRAEAKAYEAEVRAGVVRVPF